MWQRVLIFSFSLLIQSWTLAVAETAHMFTFKSIDGEPSARSEYTGKAILVVNTASRCGFTQQYNGLQSLWEKYRDNGLVVIGVPSNDFGGQEPGTEKEIKEFCKVNFNISFPMTEKNKSQRGTGAPIFLVGNRRTWQLV